jgi:acyl-coenzyme A thioesterase PaaI-like protein
VDLAPGRACVELETTPVMAADEQGLVHGGFVFGAADYAAMLAVNDPNVVLGSAQTRFLAPVRVGETVVAEATVVEESGKKRVVEVGVRRGDDLVVEARLVCFVLEKHVLE